MTKAVEEIIQKAEETLKTARFGYEDLISRNRARRYSGLRNLIVFGRSVTFVLQNLKTPLGGEAFDRWYSPIQDSLKANPIMKYFVDLRNEILKQGKTPATHISANASFSSSDLSKLGTPPPGASGFFIGDQTGGSGWVVQLPDGSEVHYYIDIPESIAKVTQHFADLPVPEDHELRHKSIEDLCDYYLVELEKLIDSARKEFLNQEVQKVGKIRLPPNWRVIK